MKIRKQTEKLLSLLLSLAVCLGMTALPVSAAQTAYELGDYVEEGDPNCKHVFSYSNPKETLQSSCTETGYLLLICPLCGAKQVYGIINPTAHQYVNGVCRECGAVGPGSNTGSGETTTDPGTSTNPGTGSNTGSAGQPGGDNLCANGHSWITPYTTVQATCTAEGRLYRVCSVCGEEETMKVLPKLEGPSANAESGSASLSKLSKREIVDLLNAAPTTTPSDVFVTAPSCTAPYSAGEVKTEVLDAAAARLSALRRIAGLPAVTADPALCEQAQYGAVLLAASEFSHTPARPSDMDSSFYSKASAATSSSNIYAGLAFLSTPDGFMDDSDASNVSRLGHRRWQLNPSMGKVGFGYAVVNTGYSRYTAEKVFDSSANTKDYDYIAWPASGNFPNDLSCFTNTTAWSVSLNPSRYQSPRASSVTVTLTRESDGKTWSFSGENSYRASGSGLYFNIDNGGYGVNNCIIFRPDGISKYEGVYTVSIQGLKDKSGSDTELAYQVDFFATKGSVPTEPEEPEKPTQPTNPTIIVDNIPAKGTAYVSNQTVTVDGKPVVFQMYALKDANGNLTNYIKLRDMAYILNGTKAQFSVGYDGAISVVPGQRYAASGAEMSTPFNGDRSYRGGAQAVKVNGSPVNMTAITLTDANGGDYNYFKLRDLGKALGFNVGYSNASGVFIESDKPYTE